jgi:2',3'-cyclic-nucleotide 2'-phosphodiesterase (5'-nucleotidase family)
VGVTAPFRNEGRTESALGNLVVDLMRQARPTADVALYNWGGLRASIPAGPLTYGRLYELIPFDNAFASLQLTAEDFGRVIVRSLERGYVHSFAGVRVDVRCDGGAPLATVWRAGGERLAPHTRLTVVITDFLASGGDGIFEGIPGDRPIEPGPPMRDVLAETLAARGGTLSGDDPAFFDPAHRRLVFPGTLPLRCPEAKAITPAH